MSLGEVNQGVGDDDNADTNAGKEEDCATFGVDDNCDGVPNEGCTVLTAGQWQNMNEVPITSADLDDRVRLRVVGDILLDESIDHRVILLNKLMELPPNGFERLCQRLLRESGFESVTVTGRSGDGGLDGLGILEVNPLVSFKVLFQCKRYSGSVTPSQVRDFRGAMMGRADKGIILTTGTFTSEARKEAIRDGVPPIELVDGEKLLDMFEELELGLKPKTAYDVDEKTCARSVRHRRQMAHDAGDYQSPADR